MKSDFIRFLHHILSHSDVQSQPISSLSHSDLIGVSRSNQVANLSNLDIRIKPEYDNIEENALSKPDGDAFVAGASTCRGRSMVEMLGVLAIIGVLSVGAIAGYSKAMFKYKLNQHAQAVNMLINNVLSIKNQLSPATDNDLTYYGTILYKLNLLPEGIRYISDTYLEDIYFKNRVWVYTYTSSAHGGIGFYIPPTAEGAEICRNIAFVTKENAANLWVVEMQKHYNDTSKPFDYIGNLWGDNYCSNGQTCLRNLDLNKTERLCNDCNERSCYLHVLWK